MAKKALMGVLVAGFAAAAVAATIAFAVPAAAETGGQAAVAGQAAAVSLAADHPAYCDRIDKALVKRQDITTRLEGDTSTKGSIAWLTAKAATATTAGNADQAKLYTDRAALRSQVLEPLKTITGDLVAIQQAHCS
jgi:hypothetical protein